LIGEADENHKELVSG